MSTPGPSDGLPCAHSGSPPQGPGSLPALPPAHSPPAPAGTCLPSPPRGHPCRVTRAGSHAQHGSHPASLHRGSVGTATPLPLAPTEALASFCGGAHCWEAAWGPAFGGVTQRPPSMRSDGILESERKRTRVLKGQSVSSSDQEGGPPAPPFLHLTSRDVRGHACKAICFWRLTAWP